MKTWTVKPYYTPDEDYDPLGVFEIQEVKAEAESWDDASLDADPNSDEEQAALDRRDKVTSEAMALIAATPDLLAALEAIKARINGVYDCPALVAFGPLHHDTQWDCLRIAEEAIAKAKGEIK